LFLEEGRGHSERKDPKLKFERICGDNHVLPSNKKEHDMPTLPQKFG
jgi:hypothetical protein